ncbi:hypothetical protein DH2020_043501 [Rehmannia glutinosa]|uniref:Bet v I/Major latex protein domain-containing protein n=1 Tax=Rehmannia glutinosa TaxID=99300 RepID=A0ABR0UKD7_REHGL
MGITKYTQEIKLRVPAKRMFKAMVTESYTILPKIIPNAIKSSDLLQGDGGVGTIRQTNFPDAYVKHRIDALDTENCVSKYTLIEGPMLGDPLESVYYNQKFEDTSDGGCIFKTVSEYYTKGDAVFKQDDIKNGNDQAIGFYTLTEEYLLANPDVCA